MPKLQRAKTVACGLLRWDRCCIIVVSHWSKPAGQNMASLLVVVGFRTSHSMPKEESHVIFSKNLPLKGEPPPRATARGKAAVVEGFEMLCACARAGRNSRATVQRAGRGTSSRTHYPTPAR